MRSVNLTELKDSPSAYLRLTGALVGGDMEGFEAELERRPESFSPWLSRIVDDRLAPTAFCLLPDHPQDPWQTRAREELRPHYQANWRR